MLTQEQEKVAQHSGGNALVIAGPGSGKSTSARHLISNHIKNGLTSAEQMLVVMFNVDTAKDFEQGLRRLLGGGTNIPAVSTLHAAGYRALKNIYRLGLAPPKSLKDDHGDSFWRGLVARAIADVMGIHIEDVAQGEIDLNLQHIAILKANLISPEEITSEVAEAMGMADRLQTAAVYSTYEQERVAAGALSFDDLIYELVQIAMTDPRAREAIGNRYRLIIVDEFQDMNRGNLELIRLLAGESASVVAIGDDDQSIYGFRGCSPYYMTDEFSRVFEGTTRYHLSTTFRFGADLCQTVNAVISHNESRIDKKICPAEHPVDTKIGAIFTDHQGEATTAIVKDALQETHGRIGVLVRAYHQTVLSEIALTAANIPYVMEGNSPFFDRRDALATVGYLGLSMGQLHDRRVFGNADRVMKMVRAMLTIPTRFMRKADMDAAAEHVARGGDLLDWAKERAQQAATEKNSYSQRLVGQLMHLIQDGKHLRETAARNPSAAEMIRATYGRLKLHQDIGRSCSAERQADRTASYAVMADFAESEGLSVHAFVARMETVADQHLRNNRLRRRPARVVFTSWHRTKGREFSTVILPDLAAGKAPYVRDDNLVDIEEERRLFYVAMTRAMERLYFVIPEDRALLAHVTGSEMDSADMKPLNRASPFLWEIENWDPIQIAYDRSIHLSQRVKTA